jgi:hypothetical protein
MATNLRCKLLEGCQVATISQMRYKTIRLEGKEKKREQVCNTYSWYFPEVRFNLYNIQYVHKQQYNTAQMYIYKPDFSFHEYNFQPLSQIHKIYINDIMG